MPASTVRNPSCTPNISLTLKPHADPSVLPFGHSCTLAEAGTKSRGSFSKAAASEAESDPLLPLDPISFADPGPHYFCRNG